MTTIEYIEVLVDILIDARLALKEKGIDVPEGIIPLNQLAKYILKFGEAHV